MRPPIQALAAAFAAGCAAVVCGAMPWAFGVAALGAALAWRGRSWIGGAAAVALLAGTLWSLGAARAAAATCAGRWTSAAGPVTRAAYVRLADRVTDGGVVDARAESPCGGALRLRWPAGRDARGGTRWLVAGRWVGQGPRGVLVARAVRLLDGRPRGRGAWRDRIATLSATLYGRRAPLVDALVIGRRADLGDDVRERFAAAGLAHLLAISGLHVGFLAAWLAVALRRIGRPALEVAAGLAAVVLYLALLGFPAPATRAGAMLAVAGVARLRERRVSPRGAIPLAALVVLFVDPAAVASVGAWLSVLAVAGVVWGVRAAEGAPRAVRLLLPAVAATLATAPVTALAFGTVAPIGVLANLVAIPVSAVAIPGLALSFLAFALLPPLGVLLAAGAGAGLALVDLVARAAAWVPGGHIVTTAGWEAALAWLAVALAARWLWRTPRRPWRLALRVAALAALVAWTGVAGAVSLDGCRCLTVHFLDVGQGDAALLRTPGGRWIVIDGGPRAPGFDAGRAVVVPFLRRHGARSVAVVVATHGDADHLGGLPAVVDAFPPALALEPGEPLGRPLYLEWLADVEASGAAWRPARAGDRIAVDGVTLEVLSPDSAWIATPADVNDHGVVLRVRYGATRLLFQADAGLPVEARLAGRVGAVDVLKVGHHGSRSATSDAWLDELVPHWAVISVGAHNRYGHPAPEVLARLARHAIIVLRTDRLGTITFTTDGAHASHDGSDDDRAVHHGAGAAAP